MISKKLQKTANNNYKTFNPKIYIYNQYNNFNITSNAYQTIRIMSHNPLFDNHSKTEQLIYRISYKTHKKKLHDIKHKAQNTSLQFYNSAGKRPEDRKKILYMKAKREEIEHENNLLKKKIEKIRENHYNYKDDMHSADPTEYYRKTVNMKLNANRYDDPFANKIEVTSDCEGESIKCFVPTVKNRHRFISESYNKAKHGSMFDNKKENGNIDESQQNAENATKGAQQTQNHEEKVQNSQQNAQANKEEEQSSSQSQGEDKHKMNRKLSKLIQKSTPANSQYNHPEQQPYRLVVYKKTKIPEPFTSYLIELSLINKQLLITAYGMGAINNQFRLLLNSKKTKQLYEECNRDYETVWNRIIVTADGNIRIANTDQIVIQKPNQENKDSIKEKYQFRAESIKEMREERQEKKRLHKMEVQKDFLQRNYYTLIKDIKDRSEAANSNVNTSKNYEEGGEQKKRSRSTNKVRESYVRKKLEGFLEQNPQEEKGQKEEQKKQKKMSTENKIPQHKVSDKKITMAKDKVKEQGNAIKYKQKPKQQFDPKKSNKINLLVKQEKNKQQKQQKQEQKNKIQNVKKISKESYNLEEISNQTQEKGKKVQDEEQSVLQDKSIAMSGISSIKKLDRNVNQNNQNEMNEEYEDEAEEYEQQIINSMTNINNESKKIGQNQSVVSNNNNSKHPGEVYEQYVSEYESINNSNVIKSSIVEKQKKKEDKEKQKQKVDEYEEEYQFEEQIDEVGSSQMLNNNSSAMAVKKAGQNNNKSGVSQVEEEYGDQDFEN